MKTLTSCWVFASAGSGKTKILVDRIIRFLLADVSPNKILCLTFTKTGAAEMQQRINARLAELVLASDEELKKKLRELGEENKISKARALFAKILDSDDRLKIQTIHSFCQGLIKIFPFESGVKPAFEILEENQSKLLLGQAQKLVLRDALRDEKLGKLVAELNAKLDEEGLSELVAELVEHHQETDTQDLISTTNLFQNFLSKLDYKENIKLAAELAVSGSTKNQESAEKIKKFFRDPSLKNFFTYQSAFFTNENEPRKIYGKNSAELENITRKQSALILEFSEELNSATINNDTALLLSFTNKITTKYRELKNQRALLDYNDLIATSNKLLTNPNFADWVKMKMDGSFDHILIDESQDTNHQQWSIIKALTEDFFSGLSAANKQRSIFVVGDEKQSIFSFQGSDPNISNEIFSYFQNRFGSEFKKVELHDSFRSTADVLAAVDKVFLDPERRVAITKNEAEVKHQATRAGQGLVEIWPKAENPEILAQKIASWIQEKSLRYGDVMVLLRNRTNGLFEALIKNFHRYQIPFTSIARIKFSESLLIQDLLAAAKFVLLPQDDLNLACLLKSPIFDFSEEDLLNICVKKNTDKTSIYKALEGSKTRESLDELITKSQQLNCFEFFYFLLHGQ
ncbi:MAG: hypothetical protein FJX34_04620, partial [Alphaproteobacteria bacterium]|nr:hypothetical protein [Alphaproteobacteria bacterium]